MLVSFRIREFRFPEDYPQVIDLWQSVGPGVHIGLSDRPEEIAKKLQRDPQLFLVAEQDNCLVGSVIGGFDGRRGMMYHLAVAEQARRQGIGEALMNALEDRLRKLGCLRYYLLVTPDNETAMRFYEHRNWEQLDLHIYGKDLDNSDEE